MPQPILFPNLFEEVSVNLVNSIFVFVIADMRRLARNGVLVWGADQVLNLPLYGTQVRPLLRANKDAVKGKVRSMEYRAVQLIMEDFFEERQQDTLDASILHYFGDAKAEEECVYGISTNSIRKAITVTFRGSITFKDWKTDATMVWDEIENPMYDKDDQDSPETIFLHKGFRDYLYGKSDFSLVPLPKILQTERDVNDVKKSKIEIILEQVEYLLKEHPDHALYLTGHSLGGALALITAHEAAARFGTRDRPVTCVAVANPKVGGMDFRNNIQMLEEEQRLRCLLVHNNMDLVPLQPNALSHCGTCRCNRREFCMQGMQLTLYKNRFKLRHHSSNKFSAWGDFRSRRKSILIHAMCWIRMAEQHNYVKYLKQLVAQRDKLSGMYLDDLYNKEGIGDSTGPAKH